MKAVIFDMDGLMFDTERVHIMAWDYAAEKLGWDCPGIDMVKKTLGMSIPAAEEVWRSILGDSYDRDALDKYSSEFLTDYFENNKVPVKEGLYPLLDRLDEYGYKYAVASSTNMHGVMRNLKSAGLESRFDALVTGDMIENSKPAPDIFLKACELLGVKPDEAFALEDSRNGLLSAINAGCRTIMVPDLWEGDKEIDRLLFAKCDTLNDVINIIGDID